ncbi:MAG: AsmA-like C-terminal domain-containing protein, partial [Desulfatitalea sp.]|nr:AsmA-like C-terminal domain-containing protein [Desulfatitalea sp.]
ESTHVSRGRLKIGLTDAPLTMALSVQLDADLAQLPPLLKGVLGASRLRDELDHLSYLSGRATGDLVLKGPVDDLQVEVAVSSFNLTAGYDRLPHPLKVKKGQVTYRQGGIDFHQVDVQLKDSMADGLSGRIGLGTQTSLDLTCRSLQLSAGQLHSWAAAGFPDYASDVPIKDVAGVVRLSDLKLKSPRPDQATWHIEASGSLHDVSLHLDRLTEPLDIPRGRFQIAGARLYLEDVDLAMRDGKLNGGALITLYPQEKRRVALSITGELGPHLLEDLIATFHLPKPQPTLNALRIARLDLKAQDSRVDIEALNLGWNEHHAQLKGQISRQDRGLSLDLDLVADHIDLNSLTSEKKAPEGTTTTKPKGSELPWPQLYGNIAVQIDHLTFHAYHWTPLHAVINLNGNQTQIDVTDTNLCGLALRGTVLWANKRLFLQMTPQATQQTFQYTSGCLAGARSTERILGNYDIDGHIATEGLDRRTLIHNLRGDLNLKATAGRITNVGSVGTVTNILSYLSLNRMLHERRVVSNKNDFAYRSIAVRMRFKDGKAHFDEANLISDTVNLAAEGDVDLQTGRLHLTALASPLTTVDTLLRHIPIVGKIFKGTLVAIPIEVKGPVAAPDVKPLSPQAIGSHLIGILGRTLVVPFELVGLEPTPVDSESDLNNADH